MLEKPRTMTTIGVVQVILAASFVIWLLFFPATGGSFAWPVTPNFTAMFIGASFMVRTYIGYFLWREKYWPLLRWQRAGNLAFLRLIFLATYWHIDEMNWQQNIVLAHIWVLAYTIEPIMLFLIEPRGQAGDKPLPYELRRGPILDGLKWVMLLGAISSITLVGLMFLNPKFMDTRWPWHLDPFNARIMAAFMSLSATWCIVVYFSHEWAEVRRIILGLMIFAIAHFGTWLVMLPQLDSARPNVYNYGIIFGLAAVSLTYYYLRHELLYRKRTQVVQPANLAESQTSQVNNNLEV